MEANKPVRQILQVKGSRVHTVPPDSTVYEAMQAMAEHDIGALVVTEGDAIVGIFSERDYARKVILRGKASRDTMVRDVMTERVVTVEPAKTTGECMSLMTHHRIRHLPVVENGALVGIVSIGDVVKSVMEEQRFLIDQLENYIRGSSLG